jgi:aarF domain-containing kinase
MVLLGRASLEGSWEDDVLAETGPRRASGLLDLLPQSEEEMEAIRNEVMAREGLLVSVFDVLRRIPRRVVGGIVCRCNSSHVAHLAYGSQAK